VKNQLTERQEELEFERALYKLVLQALERDIQKIYCRIEDYDFKEEYKPSEDVQNVLQSANTV
jgi:hypothetical protein